MQQRECLQQWQASGKWFKYRGHSIFCQMSGTGPPLVLIHGFPTASWDWRGLWPLLAKHYSLITLDMIGFGFSDKPEKYRYSISDQADIFESVLQELGVNACHLLCHDYGDSVGQELLARQYFNENKIKIESLCFLNGGLFPEVHKPALIQKLLLGSMGQFVSRMISRPVLDQNMRRIFGSLTPPTDTQLKEFWYLLEYNNGRAVLHKLIKYQDERRCMRKRWIDAMFSSQIPVSLIFGMDDPVSGKKTVQKYRTLIPCPYVVELIGVGHFPHLELPEKVFENYLAFRERSEILVAH